MLKQSYKSCFDINSEIISICNLPLKHSVSCLMHSLKQEVSFNSQPRIHSSKVSSHLSVHISLRSSTLSKYPVIIHGFDPVCDLRLYLRTLQLIILVQLARDHHQYTAIIDVTQEHYEPNRSGQGFKYILCNLLLKVQVCESWR